MADTKIRIQTNYGVHDEFGNFKPDFSFVKTSITYYNESAILMHALHEVRADFNYARGADVARFDWVGGRETDYRIYIELFDRDMKLVANNNLVYTSAGRGRTQIVRINKPEYISISKRGSFLAPDWAINKGARQLVRIQFPIPFPEGALPFVVLSIHVVSPPQIRPPGGSGRIPINVYLFPVYAGTAHQIDHKGFYLDIFRVDTNNGWIEKLRVDWMAWIE